MEEEGTYTEVGDLEVVEDECETGGTLAEADAETREVDGEAEGLCPLSVDVSQSEDLSRIRSPC